jgi:hypothetical protein
MRRKPWSVEERKARTISDRESRLRFDFFCCCDSLASVCDMYIYLTLQRLFVTLPVFYMPHIDMYLGCSCSAC